MILGFNENIVHKGRVYHVQTEDGGRKNPVVTTLLFKKGIIVASKKTSYADIIKSDKLEHVVKEIMREQHVTMLKNLKDGVFDEEGERVEPQVKPAGKVEEKKGGPLVQEKGLEGVILEYQSKKEKE